MSVTCSIPESNYYQEVAITCNEVMGLYHRKIKSLDKSLNNLMVVWRSFDDVNDLMSSPIDEATEINDFLKDAPLELELRGLELDADLKPTYFLCVSDLLPIPYDDQSHWYLLAVNDQSHHVVDIFDDTDLDVLTDEDWRAMARKVAHERTMYLLKQ
jgi:hypothetical protein